MSWQETCVMEQRIQFVIDVLDGTYSMSELCRAYRISRKTGYKWLIRYQQGGLEALRNRSRAPHRHPQEISLMVKQAILAVKTRFPQWGAPKIRVWLEREHPNWQRYPAVSTIGLFLHNQHLTRPRKRRHRASPTPGPLTNGRYVNQVWCADFKGHFQTKDGCRCNPLTITDHASRYLLCCRHVERMSHDPAKTCFEQAIRSRTAAMNACTRHSKLIPQYLRPRHCRLSRNGLITSDRNTTFSDRTKRCRCELRQIITIVRLGRIQSDCRQCGIRIPCESGVYAKAGRLNWTTSFCMSA